MPCLFLGDHASLPSLLCCIGGRHLSLFRATLHATPISFLLGCSLGVLSFFSLSAPLSLIHLSFSSSALCHVLAQGHYSESDARRVTITLLDAIKYLHDQNVAHRDLKPVPSSLPVA